MDFIKQVSRDVRDASLFQSVLLSPNLNRNILILLLLVLCAKIMGEYMNWQTLYLLVVKMLSEQCDDKAKPYTMCKPQYSQWVQVSFAQVKHKSLLETRHMLLLWLFGASVVKAKKIWTKNCHRCHCLCYFYCLLRQRAGPQEGD